jgi:hypothetical protein
MTCLAIAAIYDGSRAIATTEDACQHARAMAIRFVEIHAATDPEQLNTEWVVIENDGKLPFNTRGCGMTVSRKGQKKRSELGIIDPGFVLQPGEKMRMVTGNPGTKAHGDPPAEDEVKNYFLFLPQVILKGAGTILTLTLRGLPVSKAEFDPEKPAGV